MASFSKEQTGSGWFVALGVLLIVTGMVAIAFPFVTTLSVEIFIGIFALVGGLFTIFHAFAEKDWKGFFWQLMIGALYVMAGFAFLVAPLSGVIALTIFLGMVFMIEGIARVIIAFRVRPEHAWGWVLASGGLSLILGFLVLAGIANGASLGFIGAIFGINFIFAGVSFIALGNGRGENKRRQTV